MKWMQLSYCLEAHYCNPKLFWVTDLLIFGNSILFFRQKQSIFQLQQQLLLQTNTAMQQAVPTHYHISRSQSTGESNSLSLKLQECQYENAQLRAHLAEKDSSLDKLQKKLGWESDLSVYCLNRGTCSKKTN